MRIEVLHDGDRVVTYRVIDNQGKETLGTLDASFKEKAKNVGQPIEIAVAQEIGIDLEDMPIVEVSEEGETQPSGITVDNLRKLFSVSTHEHPHDHPHNHDDSYAPRAHDHLSSVENSKGILALKDDLTKLVDELGLVKRELTFHKHATEAHPHPEIDGKFDAVRAEIVEAGKTKAHVHGEYATATSVNEALAKLAENNSKLIDYVNQVASGIEAKIPIIPEYKQETDRVAVLSIVKEELASRRSKAHFQEISSQEVAGKQRYVVEEI